jgi:hypothetical protein
MAQFKGVRMMRTSSGVSVAKTQPRRDTLMQVLLRQAVVEQDNIRASGVTVAKAQPKRDTLMQVLPRQAIVRQHNVGTFE